MGSQQHKRPRLAGTMVQRRIQRGRPSLKHGTAANYGAPKAWQCGWDNDGAGPVCQKSFGRKSDLQRHHHTHTGTRNHACTFEGCGKTFIQTSALTVHIRTHTGEKPHECSVCSKRFSDSSSLARHRKIHSNERPYPCHVGYCDKSFCRKSTLHKHIERDHASDVPAHQDADGYYDESATVSPITPGGEAASEIGWSASAEGMASPFAALSSQNVAPQALSQHQQQATRSPFTAVPQQGTPDPTYRNYPYPDLSMGQIQNLSAAEIRGFHPTAIPPRNLVHSRQDSTPRIPSWNNNHGRAVSSIGVPMQIDCNQPIMGQDNEEYAPRSAPVEHYQDEIPYSHDNDISNTHHQHRRSASDVSALMLYQQQQRLTTVQPQRHSVDANASQLEHVQQHVSHFQSQPPNHQTQRHVVEEPEYVQGPVEYNPNHIQQQHHHQPQQQLVPQQPTQYIEAVPSSNDTYAAYQEPRIQDMGVIPQTYAIPMNYNLGSVVSYQDDDDKYKYDNTFGEAFPSQIY